MQIQTKCEWQYKSNTNAILGNPNEMQIQTKLNWNANQILMEIQTINSHLQWLFYSGKSKWNANPKFQTKLDVNGNTNQMEIILLDFFEPTNKFNLLTVHTNSIIEVFHYEMKHKNELLVR